MSHRYKSQHESYEKRISYSMSWDHDIHGGVTLQIWYDYISKNPDFTSSLGFTTPLNQNWTIVNPKLRSSSGFSQVPQTGPRVWFRLVLQRLKLTFLLSWEIK